MKQGFKVTPFPVPAHIQPLVESENWNALDAEFQALTGPEGEIFHFLKTYHDFDAIEFIISIRDSQNEWEEDGIWHDDGSRVFAFSLSLTLDPRTLVGGKLGVRKKGETTFVEVPTPKFGEGILFLTGVHGFEHKIHQVFEGRRIIIAGWCSVSEAPRP
jgi:hypothetical protein